MNQNSAFGLRVVYSLSDEHFDITATSGMRYDQA